MYYIIRSYISIYVYSMLNWPTMHMHIIHMHDDIVMPHMRACTAPQPAGLRRLLYLIPLSLSNCVSFMFTVFCSCLFCTVLNKIWRRNCALYRYIIPEYDHAYDDSIYGHSVESDHGNSPGAGMQTRGQVFAIYCVINKSYIARIHGQLLLFLR